MHLQAYSIAVHSISISVLRGRVLTATHLTTVSRCATVVRKQVVTYVRHGKFSVKYCV